MRGRVDQDVILGVLALVFGLFVIFYWAPVDSDTGIAEKVRGRWSVGDALAPTVAGGVIVAAGLLAAVGGALRGGASGLSGGNLRYLLALVAILAVSFAVIRFLGPLAAGAAGEEYRLLRDTVPWKYIGFVFGGGGMIFALISLAEGRLSARRLALALAIAAVLALIYDLPFEDLIMPPNGDV